MDNGINQRETIIERINRADRSPDRSHSIGQHAVTIAPGVAVVDTFSPVIKLFVGEGQWCSTWSKSSLGKL